jgi:single-stranded-DNA-specific exonuclease
LAQELGVPGLIGELLWQRGLQTAETAGPFLDPRLQALGDPFELTDMRLAAERIVAALARQERVAIFGDYDVDGLTSISLLWRVLRGLGGQPDSFLPNRLTEGYGLSQGAVERCVREFQPQLLIAVDCGTTAVAEVTWLNQQGIDVVILDHHELTDQLPRSVALVNPHRDNAYLYLCSVGLVFKLCHAILKCEPSYRERIDLRHYLDLVAVGTVADIVPLREDNRIFVKNGLTVLEKTRNPGLRALCQIAGIRRTPRPEDVGFRIGPRLNASGRLDDATQSLRLLTTDDPEEARHLAQSLDVQNRERQQVEQRIYDEALELLRQCFDHEQDWAIVLGHRGWHAGVIGIVAARFQRMFYRPTIIIGFDENGVGKGSGRSIAGCSLVEGLRKASDCLEKFGGHEMAAGLSLHESELERFRGIFHQYVKEALSVDQLQPRLELSGSLEVDQIGSELFEDLEKLAPFGRENPQPVFAFHHIRHRRPPQVIKKHLKLFLQGESGNHEAIGFGFAERPMPEDPLSVAGALEWDDYSNRVHLRLVDWQTGTV